VPQIRQKLGRHVSRFRTDQKVTITTWNEIENEQVDITTTRDSSTYSSTTSWSLGGKHKTPINNCFMQRTSTKHSWLQLMLPFLPTVWCDPNWRSSGKRMVIDWQTVACFHLPCNRIRDHNHLPPLWRRCICVSSCRMKSSSSSIYILDAKMKWEIPYCCSLRTMPDRPSFSVEPTWLRYPSQ